MRPRLRTVMFGISVCFVFSILAATPVTAQFTITGVPVDPVPAGTPISFTVDIPGIPFIAILPPGAEFTGGTFSWTPTEGQVGTWVVEFISIIDFSTLASVTIMVSPISGANEPPVADAGPDQTVECTSFSGAQVMLDGTGSFDADGDALTFTWKAGLGEVTGPTPTITLPLGTNNVILTVDDGNGGTDTDVVVIDVVDTKPPTIALIGDNPLTLECPTPYIEPGANVSDACDPSPTLFISGNVNPAVPGTYNITYVATDEVGNISLPVVRTVNVVDTTPPTIALIGDNPLTLECPAPYVEPGVGVSDNCDPNPSLEITGSVDSAVPGTYVITYTATDGSGNQASVERTVNVVDTTPPTIALIGDNPLTLDCGATYDEPGATVSDNCDPNPTLVIAGIVDHHVPGDYFITYTATDASGNSASEVRTVTVVIPVVDALCSSLPSIIESVAELAEDHSVPRKARKYLKKSARLLERAHKACERNRIEKAFRKVNYAVRALERAIYKSKHNEELKETLRGFTSELGDLVRKDTESIIAKAICLAGEDNKHVSRAQKHFARGLHKLDHGKIRKAIHRFIAAVKNAKRAKPLHVTQLCLTLPSIIDQLASIAEDESIPKKGRKYVKKGLRDLQKAIKRCEQNKLEDAFRKVDRAIKDLQRAIKKSNGDHEDDRDDHEYDWDDFEDDPDNLEDDLNSIINQLAQLILSDTESIVEKAVNIAGEENKYVKRAQDHLARGSEKLENGRIHRAINHFISAVRRANKALQSKIAGSVSNGTELVQMQGIEISVEPYSFRLSQNYPNPFNPSTIISYELADEGFVSLKVYDILGREVANLIHESQAAGRYEIRFNAHQLPSGLYFYRLEAQDPQTGKGYFLDIKKMLLIK